MNHIQSLLQTLFIASLLSQSVAIAESDSSVESRLFEAFEELNRASMEDWTFTVEERNHDKVLVYSYLPIVDGEGPIVLQSVNGQDPTEKELEKFNKNNSPRKPKKEAREDSDGPEEMIVPGSLELVSESNGIFSYKFQPQLDMDDGKLFTDDSLRGFLEYNANEHLIESFEIWSQSSFKPKSGVKIKEMKIEIEFQRLDDGTPAVKQMYSKMKGRAFLVAGFNEELSQNFYDYKKSPVKAEAD